MASSRIYLLLLNGLRAILEEVMETLHYFFSNDAVLEHSVEAARLQTADIELVRQPPCGAFFYAFGPIVNGF